MIDNNNFILSSITQLLEDAVSATSGIGKGIETYPLSDYVFKSVFLKMTGFQEQKMKCICWEMASNDYEYRYDFTKVILGECSSFKEKQSIYKDLLKQITKYDNGFKINTDINKAQILSQTNLEVHTIFSNSNVALWKQKNYDEYLEMWKQVEMKYFASDETNIFTAVNNGIPLKIIYEGYLYRQRNRIAHNTVSYQQNLPTLKTLVDANYIYENYFLYFSILILIDKIFVELFKKYLNAIN